MCFPKYLMPVLSGTAINLLILTKKYGIFDFWLQYYCKKKLKLDNICAEISMLGYHIESEPIYVLRSELESLNLFVGTTATNCSRFESLHI